MIMGFPSKKQTQAVLKKLEKKEGTLARSNNASPLENFRFDLQQRFVVFKQNKNLSQREIAALLDIDEGKVSKILRNRLEEFSTDRLINLYGKLNPKVKLKVS